jgi:dTMP kinase
LRTGLFITFEGVDGAGKSTQLLLASEYLRNRRYKVCATREPGGTEAGEQIRHILVDSRGAQTAGHHKRATELDPLAELALMYAARAQHLTDVIRPALARGEVVLSDRFSDASVAYQGYGRRLGLDVVRAFDRIVCARTQPDLTIVLDLPPRIALARALERENRTGSQRSRFEEEGLEFQRRVRAGYLEIARRERGRVKIVPANRPPAAIQADVRKLIDLALARWAPGRQKNRKYSRRERRS